MEPNVITLEELLDMDLLIEPDVYWEGRMVDGASQSDTVSNRLPENVSGVYTVRNGEDVLLVGVSTNIRRRLANHCSFGGTNISMLLKNEYGSEKAVEIRNQLSVTVYMIEHTAVADLVEAYLIYQHKPKYNEESDGKGRKFNPAKRKQTSTSYLTANKDQIVHDYQNKKMDMSIVAARYRTTATKIKSLLEEWDII